MSCYQKSMKNRRARKKKKKKWEEERGIETLLCATKIKASAGGVGWGGGGVGVGGKKPMTTAIHCCTALIGHDHGLSKRALRSRVKTLLRVEPEK